MTNVVSTIRDWVESVLGTYSPITYVLHHVNADGTQGVTSNVIPDGLAGVDWGYLATAAILLCVVWSVFRLLGVLLQGLSTGRRI